MIAVLKRRDSALSVIRQARTGIGILALALPMTVTGQSRDGAMAPLQPFATGWLHAWSPLVRTGELPGFPPDAMSMLPGLLVAPPAPVGALWTAGSPAFAATEIDGARADIAVRLGGSSGALRRPLDPQEVNGVAVSGLAWQPVGLRAHAIGRVMFDRETLDGGGTRASGFTPYSGSPLILVDSTSPEVSRTRAVLEGTMGWELGAWGAGIGVGYEARDVTAVRALVRRSGRLATTSGTFGVGRAIGGMRASVYARVAGNAETMTMIQGLALPFIYELQGFTEVEPIEPANQGYRRRITRRTQALGATLSGRVLGTTWVVWGEGTRLRERQSSLSQDDPPSDRWSTDGASFGAVVERPMFDSLVRITGHVRALTLEGFAERRDLDGAIFRSNEEGLQADATVRITPRGSPWQFGLVVATRHESRERRDLLSALRADIESWTPGAAFEIARAFGTRTAFSAGYAASSYVPTARIFAADSLGPVVQTLLAPALEYATTSKVAQAMSLTLRQRIVNTTTVLTVQHQWLGVVGSPEPTPFRPDGTQSGTFVSVGVILD